MCDWGGGPNEIWNYSPDVVAKRSGHVEPGDNPIETEPTDKEKVAKGIEDLGKKWSELTEGYDEEEVFVKGTITPEKV